MWNDVAELFREQERFDGEVRDDWFACIPDPDDRKFAALAHASGASLLTSDRHLLDIRGTIPIEIYTPGEFWMWLTRSV